MSKIEVDKRELEILNKISKTMELMMINNISLEKSEEFLELNRDVESLQNILHFKLNKEVNDYRIEADNMGEVRVPINKYWGAQTQRSLTHFSIGNDIMPIEIVYAMALVKKCAAKVNYSHKFKKSNDDANNKSITKDKLNAISSAVDDILKGNLDEHFPLHVWQTGSGTHSNMNVNEVIANHAIQHTGIKLHPNDDVNMSQSSNDVFPTTMHIAAVIEIKGSSSISLRSFKKTQSGCEDVINLNENKLSLLQNIRRLRNALNIKSELFKDIVKVGRTHLQDAIPITFGQEISGWVSQLDISTDHIEYALNDLYKLAIGGTAVGTGFGSFKTFGDEVALEISNETGLPFCSASNKFGLLASHDSIVLMSGALKNLACSLMKIANDIRWLASGPRCGLGEIKIPENEPGSSIMPGKINPSQCEAMTMICCQIIGNDATIGMAGSQGNFELNAFKPVLIFNLLNSIRLLSDACHSFCDFCINDVEHQENKNNSVSEGLTPNIDRMNDLVKNSFMLVTALKPIIGYDKAAEIAKKASQEGSSLRQAAIDSGYLTEKEYDSHINLKDMVFPSDT
jgi:fumarate hydratase class II